jgi:hypothetical protein
MTSGRTSAIFIIVLGSGLLLTALKWGVIGGGGVGANRNENPRLFWFLFSFWAFWLFVALAMFAFTLIRPAHMGSS